MSRDRKRATKERLRLSGDFKRQAMARIVELVQAAWPHLERVQIRRLMSFTYQGLRDKRKGVRR